MQAQSAPGSAATGSPEQRSSPRGEEACGGRSALVLVPGRALVSGGGGGPRTRDLDTVTRVDLKVRRLEATVSSVPVFTDTCVEGSPPSAQTLLFVCVWGAPLPAPVSCSF